MDRQQKGRSATREITNVIPDRKEVDAAIQRRFEQHLDRYAALWRSMVQHHQPSTTSVPTKHPPFYQDSNENNNNNHNDNNNNKKPPVTAPSFLTAIDSKTTVRITVPRDGDESKQCDENNCASCPPSVIQPIVNRARHQRIYILDDSTSDESTIVNLSQHDDIDDDDDDYGDLVDDDSVDIQENNEDDEDDIQEQNEVASIFEQEADMSNDNDKVVNYRADDEDELNQHLDDLRLDDDLHLDDDPHSVTTQSQWTNVEDNNPDEDKETNEEEQVIGNDGYDDYKGDYDNNPMFPSDDDEDDDDEEDDESSGGSTVVHFDIDDPFDQLPRDSLEYHETLETEQENVSPTIETATASRYPPLDEVIDLTLNSSSDSSMEFVKTASRRPRTKESTNSPGVLHPLGISKTFSQKTDFISSGDDDDDDEPGWAKVSKGAEYKESSSEAEFEDAKSTITKDSSDDEAEFYDGYNGQHVVRKKGYGLTKAISNHRIGDNDFIENVSENENSFNQVNINKKKPTKKDAVAKKEIASQKSFQKNRDALTNSTFHEFNSKAFGGGLSSVAVTWSSKLRTTAGLTRCKQSKKDGNATDSRQAIIELSTKCLTDGKRLRSTLLHEMCHAAAWIIDGVVRPPHGPCFDKWVKVAARKVPDVVVTTTHGYDIDFKFAWACTTAGCGVIIRRHSRSLDTTRFCCGNCKGQLVEIEAKGDTTDIVPRTKAPLSAYNIFVKNHSQEVRQRLAADLVQQGLDPVVLQSHVLKECARLWRAQQQQQQQGDTLG